MIRIILRSRYQCATEDTDYLPSNFIDFCNLYRLHIFCDSVQLKYVGTASYDFQNLLVDIYLALSKL